ncbi:hypothetical protein GGX14DRAFT_481443 [Mycena pura]|uniref:Uncharacterized protein n=1 Tax=Mycena pura TaxID=153505 RepID=A0AAD6UVY2_9AGAR|nr:hypothetical protein GGX14DRAFT_481443 [Mycena pura]
MLSTHPFDPFQQAGAAARDPKPFSDVDAGYIEEAALLDAMRALRTRAEAHVVKASRTKFTTNTTAFIRDVVQRLPTDSDGIFEARRGILDALLNDPTNGQSSEVMIQTGEQRTSAGIGSPYADASLAHGYPGDESGDTDSNWQSVQHAHLAGKLNGWNGEDTHRSPTSTTVAPLFRTPSPSMPPYAQHDYRGGRASNTSEPATSAESSPGAHSCKRAWREKFGSHDAHRYGPSQSAWPWSGTNLNSPASAPRTPEHPGPGHRGTSGADDNFARLKYCPPPPRGPPDTPSPRNSPTKGARGRPSRP